MCHGDKQEYGNMIPETLDNYICMVSCYIIITGSHLVFVCVMVTSKNMVI